MVAIEHTAFGVGVVRKVNVASNGLMFALGAVVRVNQTLAAIEACSEKIGAVVTGAHINEEGKASRNGPEGSRVAVRHVIMARVEVVRGR